jgi:hypothetical protein
MYLKVLICIVFSDVKAKRGMWTQTIGRQRADSSHSPTSSVLFYVVKQLTNSAFMNKRTISNSLFERAKCNAWLIFRSVKVLFESATYCCSFCSVWRRRAIISVRKEPLRTLTVNQASVTDRSSTATVIQTHGTHSGGTASVSVFTLH